MKELEFDNSLKIPGVTPFPDEPYELALVLYETCSVKELELHLQNEADELLLKKWNLTREQYRDELLFAKNLIESD